MNKHTPGPWGLETVPTSAGSCHKIGPFPSMGVRPQVHACVYADGIHLGLDERSPVAVELLANARLIAAAPELLEACQTFAEWLRREDEGFVKAGNSRDTPEGEAAWLAWYHENLRICALAQEQVAAAIAKATGAA